MKVLILIEAERHENAPHPEVGMSLPEGWTVLPVDSSLWLTSQGRKACQRRLWDVAQRVKKAMR